MLFTISQASGKTDVVKRIGRLSQGGEVAAGRWFVEVDTVAQIMDIIDNTLYPVIISANEHITIYDDFLES